MISVHMWVLTLPIIAKTRNQTNYIALKSNRKPDSQRKSSEWLLDNYATMLIRLFSWQGEKNYKNPSYSLLLKVDYKRIFFRWLHKRLRQLKMEWLKNYKIGSFCMNTKQKCYLLKLPTCISLHLADFKLAFSRKTNERLGTKL